MNSTSSVSVKECFKDSGTAQEKGACAERAKKGSLALPLIQEHDVSDRD